MSQTSSTDTVTLVSSDGKEFKVDRQAAMVSGTIRAMLSGPGNFAEKEQDRIEFHEISSNILEKVIQYFHYKQKYHASTGEIPEFPIEPEIALELLMAANFLDA